MYKARNTTFDVIHRTWAGAEIWSSCSFCKVSDANSNQPRKYAIAIPISTIGREQVPRDRGVKWYRLEWGWHANASGRFSTAPSSFVDRRPVWWKEKCIAQLIPPLGESSDYQDALYFWRCFYVSSIATQLQQSYSASRAWLNRTSGVK